MYPGLAGLEWLLDYEIRSAKRYKRYVTVAMAVSGMGQELSLHEILKDCIRESDEMIELDPHHNAILMGETNLSESVRAISRFNTFCEGRTDVFWALAAFPEDRGSAKELLSTLYRRIQNAKEGRSGGIEYSG